MKLYVLTENAASDKCLAEHGLSYFIEHDVPLLFDTGRTDVFRRNAERMALDLDRANTVVLSHGHYDHGDGLQHLRGKRLVCHPLAFRRRFGKNEKENLGLALDREELQRRFEIVTSSEPYRLSEQVAFLGGIPRRNAFESKTTDFVLENGSEDFVDDDSGLALAVGDELVVVSGCAHSGICNMVEHARAVTGLSRIRAVIGGFHLKDDGPKTQETVRCLQGLGVRELYPSHCTELPALCAFHQAFRIRHLRAGMVLTF